MKPTKDEIISIEKLPDKTRIVYDLEIDDNHTFLANEIFVHNTDSVHLRMEFKTLEEAIKHGLILEDIINKSFDEFVKSYGLKEHGFKVKLEAIAEGALYKAKKRYAFLHVWEDGHILDEPNYKIVGLEPKRSDSPEITEEVMTKVLKMILNKATIKEIDEYVDVEYTKIVEHEYTPFEIGIPKGINKKLSDYFYGKCRVKKLKAGTIGCGYIEPGVLPFTDKEEYQNRRQHCPKCGNKLTYTKPIHAFAADYSNNYLDTDLKGGTKTRYLYVKDTGRYPPTHVVALDEDLKLPKDFKVDYVMQARKIVLDKISPLTDLIKVSKQTKLGA